MLALWPGRWGCWWPRPPSSMRPQGPAPALHLARYVRGSLRLVLALQGRPRGDAGCEQLCWRRKRGREPGAGAGRQRAKHALRWGRAQRAPHAALEGAAIEPAASVMHARPRIHVAHTTHVPPFLLHALIFFLPLAWPALARGSTWRTPGPGSTWRGPAPTCCTRTSPPATCRATARPSGTCSTCWPRGERTWR